MTIESKNVKIINQYSLPGIRKLEKSSIYFLVYDLPQKNNIEQLDFTDISKFFTYIETLKILNSKYDYSNINVIINGISKESNYFRLESFLYAQSIICNDNSYNLYIGIIKELMEEKFFSDALILELTEMETFYCKTIEHNKKKNFKHILPMFCVAGKRSGKFCTNYIQFSDLTNSKKSINNDQFEDIKNKALDIIRGENNQEAPVKIYTNQMDLLMNIITDNLMNFFTGIKGNEKIRISMQKKEAILQLFCEKYKTRFTNKNLLTQFIWSAILSIFNENKVFHNKFYESSYSLDEEFFEESTIEKSLCDAIAYAEGIYQIMENSIKHTRFQIVNFSLRVYDVRLKSRKNSDFNEKHMINALEKREYLKEKFFKEFDLNSTDYSVDNYMEFIISDSAFTERSYEGIVDNFNNNHNDDTLTNLTNLFQKKLSNNEISEHYGIQLFEKNLLVNHAVFTLSTPNKMQKAKNYEIYKSIYYPESKKLRRIDEVFDSTKTNESLNLYATCYDMLLPIKYDWDETKVDNKKNNKKISEKSNRWLFEEELIENSYIKEVVEIKSEEISNVFANVETGIELYEQKGILVNRLVDLYRGYKNNNSILNIDADAMDYQQIELLAKSIFQIIYKRHNEERENTLIAVTFNYEEQINEFVRFFSVFYDKKGVNELYENVQIALFIKNYNNRNIPTMTSIIAGEQLKDVYNTAVLYSYSNANCNSNYVEHCKYLVRTVQDNNESDEYSNIVPLFPFDLFLPSKEKSYFLDNLKYDIEHYDLRQIEFGCKINDINIRLGSKIHLEDFYEAELIFHNVDVINKLAFLIATEIECAFKTTASVNTKNIMIVGYESYSSLLVQEIVKLLRTYHSKIDNNKQEVNHCIYTVDDSGKEVICYSPEVMYDENRDALINNSIYFTVMPISTTFTTVYKMQNVIRRFIISKCNSIEKIRFGDHYSIILVKNKTKDENFGYWEFFDDSDNSPKKILLSNEIKNQKDVYVYSYIVLETQWYKSLRSLSNLSEREEYFNTAKTQVYVDKTSTIPSAAFKMFNNTNELENDPNEKSYTGFSQTSLNGKIESLYGCVKYGHISKKDNHFQYYIDKEKYCIQEKDKIIKWLDQNRVWKNDFNIIISPLHNPDSVFLKLVLDYGFSHNYRLIHMPIYDTRRDDIRSKFSYIAKQFKEIKLYNSSARLNFYFVDNSIITGRTLNRSLTLVRALMSECGMEKFSPRYFAGIFTLINRSAYNTISKYVKNVNNDYHSFLYVFVPNYNTHRNTCPTCELVNKYRYLSKNSSTNLISNKYEHLAEKRKIRSISEYNEWLKDQILNSTGYYSWLKQWLYISKHSLKEGSEELKKSNVLCQQEINNRDDLYDEIVLREKSYYNLLSLKEGNTDLYFQKNDEMNKLCLSNYEDEFQKIGIELFLNHIQSQKNHIRVITVHELFEKFENIKMQVNGNVEQIEEVENCILDYILNNFSQKSWSDGMESFISVIKVASRPLLSQFYHIRQAMQNIIIGLLDGLINDNGRNSNNKNEKYNKIICKINVDTKQKNIESHMLKYQLLICLVRRLTDLHSNYFLNYNNLNLLINKIYELKMEYIEYSMSCINTPSKDNLNQGEEFDYFIFNRFVPNDDIVLIIANIIKWSSMSSDSTSSVFLINQLLEEFDNE